MSAETWPPPLKDWVAKCLGQMTDSNRAEAQAELRQVIADAFTAKTLWTTDWTAMQLKSLQPRPPPGLGLNTLKRKSIESHPAPNNKKAKKKAAAAAAAAADLNDQAALSRRALRFQREHELERQKNYSGGAGGLRSHYQHGHVYSFGNGNDSSYSASFAADDPELDGNVPGWDKHNIVGTSREMFKDYLRLTSEPDPKTIRPYDILQETLVELKQRWKDTASGGKTTYHWICSQFKSMRQDLTVQRIKNDFTVQVYEIHARMALEVGDMVEYNACQAMLGNLYELGIPGKIEEFAAYRILRLVHGQNRSDLNLYVGQLTSGQKEHPAVQHALAVQRALSAGNYHALFELYTSAPNMGGYIMDHFIERERVKALIVITKSYMRIPLTFVYKELALDSLEQARELMSELGAATFTNPNAPDGEKVLDCKPANAPLVKAFEAKYRKVQLKGRI